MKKSNKIPIIVFFAVIVIIGAGFLKTTPQRVLLVRKINWI